MVKNGELSAVLKKLNGKKLKPARNYKVYVTAYKMTEGKYVSSDKRIAAVTQTGKIKSSCRGNM